MQPRHFPSRRILKKHSSRPGRSSSRDLPVSTKPEKSMIHTFQHQITLARALKWVTPISAATSCRLKSNVHATAVHGRQLRYSKFLACQSFKPWTQSMTQRSKWWSFKERCQEPWLWDLAGFEAQSMLASVPLSSYLRIGSCHIWSCGYFAVVEEYSERREGMEWYF